MLNHVCMQTQINIIFNVKLHNYVYCIYMDNFLISNCKHKTKCCSVISIVDVK